MSKDSNLYLGSGVEYSVVREYERGGVKWVEIAETGRQSRAPIHISREALDRDYVTRQYLEDMRAKRADAAERIASGKTRDEVGTPNEQPQEDSGPTVPPTTEDSSEDETEDSGNLPEPETVDEEPVENTADGMSDITYDEK